MTDAQRERLRAALAELNSALAEIAAQPGHTVRPWCNFDTCNGYARVLVEVQTGVEQFE